MKKIKIKTFLTLLFGGTVYVNYNCGAGTHYKGIKNLKNALELHNGVVDYNEFYDEEFIIFPCREFDIFSYNNKSRIIRELKYKLNQLINWIIK